MRAGEFIKSKHNGELPYKYGVDECTKLMEAYAKQENEALKKQVDEYEDALRLRSGLGDGAVVMTKSAFNNMMPNLKKQIAELKELLQESEAYLPTLLFNRAREARELNKH